MKKLDLSHQYQPDVLVVAHGNLTSDPQTLRLLEVSRHVVVCDGALEQYLGLTERKPDAVVGDGDSVQRALLEAHQLEMVLVEEQLTNDLTKAVLFSLEKGWKRIAIVGASGKREDHAIGNVSHVVDFHFELGAEVRMYSQYGVLVPFTGELVVELEVGRQLSFFAIDGSPMSASGVLYPFEKRIFKRFWEATLNEALGGEVRVVAEGPALIYVANEVKRREYKEG